MKYFFKPTITYYLLGSFLFCVAYTNDFMLLKPISLERDRCQIVGVYLRYIIHDAIWEYWEKMVQEIVLALMTTKTFMKKETDRPKHM